MRLYQTVGVAFRNLHRQKLRAGLTTLGIVVGVAAVIAMLALGDGAKDRLEKTYSSLKQDYVAVASDPGRTKGMLPTRTAAAGPTLQDFELITAQVKGISLATPWVFLPSVQVKYRKSRSDVQLAAQNTSGFAIYSRNVVDGAAFSEADVRKGSSVCLITSSLKEKLFGEQAAIGRTLLLKGLPFEILGVVEDSNVARSSLSAEGELTIFVPITSWLRRFDPTPQMLLLFSAPTHADIQRIKPQIADVLEQNRGTRRTEFKVFNQSQGVEQIAEGAKTMAALLAAIAGVSLIVGGIGIMNIMFATVRERVREIGIRIAVGTRSKGVLLQFIVEALILSSVGGVLGIALGCALALVLTQMNGWATQISAAPVAGAFLCSTVIGVFFGYYPARQAARLDPIYALRAE